MRRLLALAVLALAGCAPAGAIDQELSYVTDTGDELYSVPTPTAVPPAEDFTDHGPCDPCTWWRELNPATHLWTLHRGPRSAMPADAHEVPAALAPSRG